VLLQEHPPCGVILFSRNVASPHQLRLLIGALRRILPAGAVMMVDQEGGRVARLRPPHWQRHPPAASLHGPRAAWLSGALIGVDCAAAGFDVVAAPVLDLAIAGAHSVIGDRAFEGDSVAVGRLGRAFAAGLLAAGIQPIGKHIPGHGRARVDSHFELPRVEANDLDADLLPFALNLDLPWAMSAHIVYPAWDPALPATLSPTVIDTIIRGRIGFEGVLVTDDIAMKALSGSPAELAKQALAAGCDVALYCSGEFGPTHELLKQCPTLSAGAQTRLNSARAMAARRRLPLDERTLAEERSRLLA
jgi:beta-N-acetylhexosaminidase